MSDDPYLTAATHAADEFNNRSGVGDLIRFTHVVNGEPTTTWSQVTEHASVYPGEPGTTETWWAGVRVAGPSTPIRCDQVEHHDDAETLPVIVPTRAPAGPKHVNGHCPMGCGQTLVLLAGNPVCDAPQCPQPLAVSDLLCDPHIGDHIVTLFPETFGVIHPLRERLSRQLELCPLDREIRACTGPPQPVGRYRVTDTPNGRVWTNADNGAAS